MTKNFDLWIGWLCVYSVATYIAELALGSSNSLTGPAFFLWSERAVASILTIEYIVRLRKDGFKYFKSGFGFIDLLSIFPFWIGFFVPQSFLSLIRTSRVLRLFKIFRCSESLRRTANALQKSIPTVAPLFFSLAIINTFFAVLLFEVEDGFSVTDSFWFTAVTMTTVGYGDISPETPIGKLITIAIFMFSLPIFGAVLGKMADAFSETDK